MDCEKARNRYDALVALRKTQDDTLQMIERFVVPFRGEFFKDMTSEHEVMWRRRFIYDATAVQANQTLAASIQGALTSNAIKWFNSRFGDPELDEDHEAKTWLEDCDREMYYQIQESNFDEESSEFYLDLTSFGTGVLFEEEKLTEGGGFDDIDFSSAPMRDCYFEHDSQGNVLRFYRRFEWDPLQIEDKFGDKIPDEIKTILAQEGNSDIDRKYEVVFCVYERKEYRGADTTKMLAPLNRPYGYKWILHKSAEMLGEEGGYYEMPAFVARWRKVNGSRWGFSPAMICLSDILTLNELVEATLEACGKVVDPAILVTERGLLSDLDLARGGMTVVRDLDEVAPFESRARFDVGDMQIDRLQTSINRAFFVDQLQLKESPAMTATEAMIRYELMQRLLGPTFGRLKADYLDPFLSRTFNILYRNKVLPPMPDIVREKQGQFQIEYTGPLARAQRQDTAQNVVNWIGILGQMAEIDEEMLDVMDSEEVARGLGELNSVPTRFMRSKDDVKKLRQERQERIDDFQASEAAKARGEGMEALGKGREALGGELGLVEQA